MAAGNPLWEVHDAIWTMLEASTDFTTEVPDGNRVNYTESDFSPEKHNLAAADVPQVMVRQAGMELGERVASNATHVVLKFEVLVHTGQQPIDRLLDVQWAVFRALLEWETYLQDALTWGGENYVRNADMISTEDSVTNKDLHRNLKGWTSVWAGLVDCWFSNAALIA